MGIESGRNIENGIIAQTVKWRPISSINFAGFAPKENKR